MKNDKHTSEERALNSLLVFALYDEDMPSDLGECSIDFEEATALDETIGDNLITRITGIDGFGTQSRNKEDLASDALLVAVLRDQDIASNLADLAGIDQLIGEDIISEITGIGDTAHTESDCANSRTDDVSASDQPAPDAVTESGFITSYVSTNGQAELILDGAVNGPGATASSVVFPVSGLPSGLISGSVIIDTQGYTYYGKGFHGAYGSSEYVDLGGVPIASFTNDGPKVWDYFPQNAAAGSQYITIPFNDMVVVNQELVIGVSANAAVDFFDATIAITSVNQAPPANQNPVSLSPTAEAAGTGTSPVRGSQVTAVDSSMASGPEYRLEGRMIEKLGPTGYEPYPILGVDDGPVGESALYNGNAHDLALLAGLGVDMVFFYNTLPATGQSLTVLNNLAAKGISVVMPVDLPFGDVASDFSSAPATLNFFKDDPTIIWTVNKNEWDLNALSDQLASQAVYTNWAAAQVKALDPGSLVFTALADPAVRPLFTSEGGDAMSTQQLLALMPAVDGFLFSSYRGDTLNGIVDELAALTDKPVGLGEYGEDSYTHGLSGQAQVDQSLTHEVVSNLAVSGGVLVGAFLFELPFESWKAPGAEQSYSLIDGAGNPKPAYYTVQQIYTQFFALSIASASVVVSAGQSAVGSTGQSPVTVDTSPSGGRSSESVASPVPVAPVESSPSPSTLVENVVRDLKNNPEFLAVVRAIGLLREKERAALLAPFSSTYKPAWAQLSAFTPESKTEAGRKAERMIAEAICALAKKLLEL